MAYTIKNPTFVGSYTDYKKCPKTPLKEFAFIGRSNVGKSSLINMLTNRSGLAKVSAKPGKTQLINIFNIDDKVHFTDLPGYGYAKVSKADMEKWRLFIMDYLVNREELYCLFVLIDIRLEPQAIDLEFMEWVVGKGVPFVMVFTKADKLTKHQVTMNLARYKKKMLTQWEEMPQYFVTSSDSGMGKEDVLKFVFEAE